MKLQLTHHQTPFLSQKMFGLFFEDINYAVDGGLYGEMIENRQFQFRKATPTNIEKQYEVTNASDYGWQSTSPIKIIHEGGLNPQNPHYLSLSGQATLTNKAYDGICMKAKQSYQLTLWLRTDTSQTIEINVTKENQCIAKTSIDLTANANWQKYEAMLEATADTRFASFHIVQEGGNVDYAYVSCMPTNLVAGIFRPDLFELLKEMHPGVLRFPGGCIVEGATLDNRYKWKDTLFEPWKRTWNWSRWCVHDVTMGQGEPTYYPYINQSYGIGFYEYFLLSELLGAKPLPVLSVGLACQFQSDELCPIDHEDFQWYLQNALDLIEFANGDVNSPYGKIRAQMGHPLPFHLEYIGIGNEQWETEKVDFFARYLAFEKAIHDVYPDIQLIGSAGPDVTTDKYTRAWDFYRKETKTNPSFTAAIDEHYYMPPAWFYDHVHMYDDYSRDIPVFAGEYAAHRIDKKNTMEAALAEAAFMCGLERNGDLIRFASTAPLFARQNYAQWRPDFIWFDDEKAMGTPSYYVQKLFGKYTGTTYLHHEVLQNEGIYTSITQDETNIYTKIINPLNHHITIENLDEGKMYLMKASSLDDENQLGNEIITLKQVPFTTTFPPYSCSVVVTKRVLQ